MATIRNVEIFAVGSYEQEDGSFKEYGESDLRTIAENTNTLLGGTTPLHQVPVVLGHDEDQPILQQEGLAAGGWAKNVRAKDGKLVCDFADVPSPIAQLINQRAYKKVSAEIYDDFVDNGGKSHGMALRRVAIEGADIPKVKGLKDIPLAVYGEKKGKIFYVHSELTKFCGGPGSGTPGPCPTKTPKDAEKQDRQRLHDLNDKANQAGRKARKSLKEKGKDSSEFKAAAQEQRVIVEQIKNLNDELWKKYGPREKYQEQTMDPEQIKAALVEMGLSEEEIAVLPPELAAKIAAAWGTDEMSEEDDDKETPPVLPAPPAAPPVPPPPPSPKAVTLKYAEMEKRIDRKLAALERRTDERIAEEKRAKVFAFCERQVKLGNMLPRDAEEGKDTPTELDTLLALDSLKTVRKFGEKSMSQLDIAMATIEARGQPFKKFTEERVKQPNATVTAELDKVRERTKKYMANLSPQRN